MSAITRSTKISGGTVLVSHTSARAADVETDMLALFNAHNNHDAGTSKWTVVSALNAAATPLIADNSSGTNAIFEAKDNGTTVLTVADGGTTTALANAGTNKALIANNGTSTGNIFEAQDGGVAVLSVADGGAVTTVPTGSTTTALTATSAAAGSGKALIANNSTSTGNIFEAQDNGTPVVTIADGGNVTLTGKALGPNGTKTVPTFSFSGDPDNGLFLNGTNNPAISAGDTLVLSAATSGVEILGATTNSSASTGFKGEYIESIAAVTNATTSNQYADLVSISLTAGDWDVTFTSYWLINGATWSAVTVGVSSTSGNSGTGLVDGSSKFNNSWSNSSATPSEVSPTVVNLRASLSGTTTYYAKYLAVYTGGPPKCAGRLSARRIR